jgi:hypothetical protein
MKLPLPFAMTVLAAALPALAAPAAPVCPAPQVVEGNKCTVTVALGWIAAGQGIDSIFSIYVPPGVSGPVEFEVTDIKSSLGSAYTGYLGVVFNAAGQTGGTPLTLADIVAGAPDSIGTVDRGQLVQFAATQVCWDPTCTADAPAGAVPNMFSMQMKMSSPNPGDIQITPNPMLTIRFLSASGVTFEETESAVRSNSPFSIIPGVSLGATPAGRYVYTGTAVNQPFDAISISNLNNPNPISGTLTVKDRNGDPVASAPIPSIPAGGAAGYLVIGRSPGDPLGLLPSNTVLPAAADGIFRGTLEVATTGQVLGGMCIVLAQEYYGNTMLNMFVYHSPVP